MLRTDNIESQQLYQQFQLYMRNGNRNNIPTNSQVMYKQLYSHLIQKNKDKRTYLYQYANGQSTKMATTIYSKLYQDISGRSTLADKENLFSRSKSRNQSRFYISRHQNQKRNMSATYNKCSKKYKSILKNPIVDQPTVKQIQNDQFMLMPTTMKEVPQSQQEHSTKPNQEEKEQHQTQECDKNNNNKFHKIEKNDTLYNEFKEMPLPQSMINDNLLKAIKCHNNMNYNPNTSIDPNISDLILLQEQQQQNLSKQICHYKKQLSLKTKQVHELKKQIKNLSLKENKFEEAQQLATNMTINTKQIMNTNNKNYLSMVAQQEAIIAELKVIKNNAKKQINEFEKQYHRANKEHSKKYDKYVNSFQPIELEEHKTTFSSGFPKENKHKFLNVFIQSVRNLLEMLQQREPNYEQAKQILCTQIKAKRIRTQGFSSERVQWFQAIEQFESKFQMRIESSFQLISQIYQKIKEENLKLEKNIFKQEYVRGQLLQQFNNLVNAQSNPIIAYHLQKESGSLTKEQQQKLISEQFTKKNRSIHTNSKIFIQIIELMNSLLLKFQYIFKLFFMMNIDKKKYNEHLVKLESVLENTKYQNILSYNTHSLNIISNPKNNNCNIANRNSKVEYTQCIGTHEDINMKEIKQIIESTLFNHQSKFNKVKYCLQAGKLESISEILEEYLLILFNDIRVPLICRKNMILEQLQFISQKFDICNWEQDIIKILTTIREECQYAYTEKFKNLSSSLLDCFRSVIKSRVSYSSSSKHGILIDKTMPLTLSMAPKIKLPSQNLEDNEELVDQGLFSKAVLSYLASRLDTSERTVVFTEQAKKNPSQMVRQLHQARNQNRDKLKLLDLQIKKHDYIPRNFIYQRNAMISNQMIPTCKTTQDIQPCQSLRISDKSKKKLQFNETIQYDQ